MSKTFRPYDPGQWLLLPAALQEWLLICVGHNLLKLFRFGDGRPGKARGSNRRSPRRTVGKFPQTLSVFTNPHPPTQVVSS